MTHGGGGAGGGGPGGAGVGRGIDGASQGGIGAATGGAGSVGGPSGNWGGSFTGGISGRTAPAPASVSPIGALMAQIQQNPQTIDMAKKEIGLTSTIGALVAMGIDPGLAAALADKPIGVNYGVEAPGTAVGSTKGDYGGPTIGGAPGTAVGSTKGHFGEIGGLSSPGTANQSGKGDFSGFSGSMHGPTSSTNSVGVRGVGPKGDFGSGFPGPRGDFGTQGLRSSPAGLSPGFAAALAAEDDAPARNTSPTAEPTSWDSDALLDQVFSGLQQAQAYFDSMRARQEFASSRRGSAGGGDEPQLPGSLLRSSSGR